MTKRDDAIQQLALQMFELTRRTWFESQREKFKGGYDLSESEFLALDALEDVTSMSVGELRKHVGVLPAQMSRVLKALEQRYEEKLVICSINPEDKRKIDVSITPKGRRAVNAYRRSKIKTSIEALHSLSDQDLVCLSEIMTKIERAYDRPKSGRR
ncbi:MAG: MarR family transcriptional regulator [Planctomycetes bacterium]|nr:MarR family transcriptional regulator [Planctomycetota bacterium]